MTAASVEQYSEFYLGNIQVIPQHNQILLKGNSVKLQPKVMAVLCYLAKHRERVISSDELIEKVWEGRVVTTGSVQKSINALRKALASLDDSTNPIDFFSKRGYQINLDIEVSQPTAATPEETVSPTKQPQTNNNKKWLLAALISTFVLLSGYMTLKQALAPSISPSTWTISQDPSNALSANLETGSKLPTPHPNGQRLAYVQALNKDNSKVNHLMIKNSEDIAWSLASTTGEWIDLAWSPSGRNLAAVELWLDDKTPGQSNFYQKPIAFYNFHIFTLDFKGENIIEKNRLSQWQGSVKNLSWWNENTLEFVASQGLQLDADRYRYEIPEQRLSLIAALPAFQVYTSAVQNKHSALLGEKDSEPLIKVLDPEQQPIKQFSAHGNNRLLWLPNTQGVLAFNTHNQKAMIFHLHGGIQHLNIPSNLNAHINRLAIADDTLWVELEYPESLIQWQAQSDTFGKLDAAEDWSTGKLSADGKSLLVHRSRATKNSLTLIQGTVKKNIPTNTPLKNPKFVWASNLKQFLIAEANTLWQIEHTEKKLHRIAQIPAEFSPLLLTPEKNRLWLVQNHTEARNLWLYHLSTQQNQQITYGSIGSALADSENIYFQYADQKGLWALHTPSVTIQKLNTSLQANIKLLHVQPPEIYYVGGKQCQESDMFLFNWNTGENKTVATNRPPKTNTLAFHPESGLLLEHCQRQNTKILSFKIRPEN